MLRSRGWRPIEVSGFDPAEVHEAYAEALASSVADIRQIQTDARRGVRGPAADWPMVVLRTPKGWTGRSGRTSGRRAWRSRHGATDRCAFRPGAARPAGELAAVLPSRRTVRQLWQVAPVAPPSVSRAAFAALAGKSAGMASAICPWHTAVPMLPRNCRAVNAANPESSLSRAAAELESSQWTVLTIYGQQRCTTFTR